jgi:pimeloyl-ACP methyl ester carboxylesterase
MKMYFVSGLGADKRVFQFLDLPGIEKSHIHWVKPAKNESLNTYCTRLLAQIDQSAEIVLVGVSFGGIVCQEIAKQISCKKVIIISSVKSRKEMSYSMRAVSITRIYKVFPQWLLKWCNLLTANYYFGVKTKEEALLLRKIIEDTDFEFCKWAIDAIMTWDMLTSVPNLYHIHGTDDQIFPAKFISNAIFLNGGTHFMIVNRAKEISELILRELQ